MNANDYPFITRVVVTGIACLLIGQVSAETSESRHVCANCTNKEVLYSQLDHVTEAMTAVEAAGQAVEQGRDDAALRELAKANEHLAYIQSWMVQATSRPSPPALGENAPDFTLYTLDRKPVQLSKQLNGGPVVIIVLRGWPGYQCPVCTRQVGQFLSRADEITDGGVDVILLYPGPGDHLVEHAEQFISGKSLPDGFHFVTDPNYLFTERYGLRWNAPKETAYPSTFVVDQNGVVRFAKVSKTHGGRSDVSEVLKAISEIEQDK